MPSFHRHSWFPFIVILLSLALGGLIYWSAQGQSSSPSLISLQEDQPLDADAYRFDLAEIIQTFEKQMAAAEDDAQKLQIVRSALTSQLALRVPAEFKDLHLALAVALSEMEHTLQTDGQGIDESLARLQELKQAYPWLAR
ncbi:hypothetical protein HY626_00300 [Candidatus Uhrbacteria bacterium]|nr:hypothetical protein [Candidatus Uhrbacteria bacterium]